MFARINYELKEREELEKARQELLKKKQSLIADNQKRKDDLASLDKDLETFIDVGIIVLCCDNTMLTSCRLRNQYKGSLKRNINALNYKARIWEFGYGIILDNVQYDGHTQIAIAA